MTSEKKDDLWAWIAWRLPKRLAYFASARVWINGTHGKWSGQVVTELTCVDALERWLATYREETRKEGKGG